MMGAIFGFVLGLLVYKLFGPPSWKKELPAKEEQEQIEESAEQKEKEKRGEEYKKLLESEEAEKLCKYNEAIRDKMLEAAKNVIIYPGSIKEFEARFGVEIEEIELLGRAQDAVLRCNFDDEACWGLVSELEWFFGNVDVENTTELIAFWKTLLDNRIYALIYARYNETECYREHQGLPVRLKAKNPTSSVASAAK